MNQEHSVVLCSLAQGDLLKNRRARALGTTGLALMLAVALGGIARAQMAPVPRPLKFALLPIGPPVVKLYPGKGEHLRSRS
jgi:hypothetical protein